MSSRVLADLWNALQTFQVLYTQALGAYRHAMAATVAKEKHAKMPHHLSRATANQDGWVESLTSLTESVAATQLLQDAPPLTVGLFRSGGEVHGPHMVPGMSQLPAHVHCRPPTARTRSLATSLT
jgi:hypothetical protein